MRRSCASPRRGCLRAIAIGIVNGPLRLSSVSSACFTRADNADDRERLGVGFVAGALEQLLADRAAAWKVTAGEVFVNRADTFVRGANRPS